jgi:hypothetical protein
MTRDEMRVNQEAAYDNFIATNPEYKQLRDLIHEENTSAADCAKFYVDQTIEFAADPDREPKIDHFVEAFAGCIVELGARIIPRCSYSFQTCWARPRAAKGSGKGSEVVDWEATYL